jgi:hypothetical protein
MKKLFRALLILPLAVLFLGQIAQAQDAMSVIMPSPWTSRVGSQLVYVFETGRSDDAAAPARIGSSGKPSTEYRSFLVITNTNITTYVAVHYQFYQAASSCPEVFNYVDVLTPGQRHIIDPTRVINAVNPLDPTAPPVVRGVLAPGRYIMTATPINPVGDPLDLRAIAFNYLTGQLWVTDIGQGATMMTHAVPRMAVDVNGGALNSAVALIANYRGFINNVFAIGPPLMGLQAAVSAPVTNNYFLQMFRPYLLIVNSFFAPGTVTQSVAPANLPFGNRLTFVSFVDQYDNATGWYKILSATANFQGFAFDILERPASLPPRSANCVTEFTIAPQTVLTINFADFVGPSLTSHVAQGGWLRISITAALANWGNLFGWFSQTLYGGAPGVGYAGGDLLIGVGRQNMTPALPITISVAPTWNWADPNTFPAGVVQSRTVGVPTP